MFLELGLVSTLLTPPELTYARGEMESLVARMSLDSRRAEKPWQEHPFSDNRLRIVEDAPNFYAEALRMIQGARNEVIFDIFLLGGPIGRDLAMALGAARDRGCSVWLTMAPESVATGATSTRLVQQRILLDQLGLPIREFPLEQLPKGTINPFAAIDHAKVLVVDRKAALMGGSNFFDISDMDHDLMARIDGPLAADLAAHLERPFSPPSVLRPAEPIANANCEARVVQSDTQETSGKQRLLELIRTAHRSMDIAVFEASDKEVIAAVIAAWRRGVKVRVIFDRHLFDDKWVGGLLGAIPHYGVPTFMVARDLVDAGVPFNWYDPTMPLQEMHLKYSIFDGETGFMGSFNWTASAFYNFREMNLEFRGPAVAQLQAVFDRDWHQRSTPASTLQPLEHLQANISQWMDQCGLAYW